jgi:hypothetical protein
MADVNDNLADVLPLENFTNAFIDGTRQNRFLVDFSPLVSIFGAEAAKDLDKMKFFVQSTQIPGKTIGAIQAHFQGLTSEYAGNLEHQDWTCTFLSDTNYVADKIIETWMNLIHNPDTNLKSLASTYKIGTKIIIYQLDPRGVVLERCEMKNVWPKTKDPKNGDSASAEFQTYSVTWSYDWYGKSTVNN